MTELSPQRLLAIVRFQTEIAKANLDLGEVIARTAQLSQLILEADGAAVELEEGPHMVYRAATGIAARQLGMRIPIVGSLSGLCATSNEMLTCEDSDTDPRVDRAACRTVGLRSMILVPLRHDGHSVGALKVMSQRPHAFQPQDLQTLELMSEVIAAAMAHATEHDARVEESRELYQRATRDSLTGLGNRALFYDRLHQSLALARRNHQRLGIALLDMDGLKRINDGHGHRAGDAAIRAMATRLKQATRETDIAARLGGDEFALLLSAIPDREAAERVGHKVVEQVRGPLVFEGAELQIGASVGIAVFPDDGADPEALLGLADEAMYAFKRTRGVQR